MPHAMPAAPALPTASEKIAGAEKKRHGTAHTTPFRAQSPKGSVFRTLNMRGNSVQILEPQTKGKSSSSSFRSSLSHHRSSSCNALEILRQCIIIIARAKDPVNCNLHKQSFCLSVGKAATTTHCSSHIIFNNLIHIS